MSNREKRLDGDEFRVPAGKKVDLEEWPSFSLSDVPTAIRALAAGRSRGKSVIKVR